MIDSVAAEADSARDDVVAAVTESLRSVNIDDAPAADMIDVVDTTAKLLKMLDTLDGLPTEPPSLYFDLEGENLSRHGSVSILQLHVLPRSRTYLVDVHTLQHTAFSTCGHNGRTLKEILECDGIPKVFFDVRNDSDALHSHFNIRLAGVQDLQLMELATRTFSKRCVNGLSRCIERDARLPATELITWKAVKDAGVKIFAPEYGGSYTVFAKRPLCDAIKLYCAQDVQILPRLWSQYNTQMTPAWTRKVHETSKERVALSQTAAFNGKGRHMALAPPGWY
jgi:exonuclease 3'-5' domain-containing protein 1